MTTPLTPPGPHRSPAADHRSHDGHGPMMLACCVPMIAVTLLLLAGTASRGALVWVLGCIVMMAAMMLLMPRHHDRT